MCPMCVQHVCQHAFSLYCYHLVLLCHSVQGETVMRSLGLAGERYVMLHRVPVIGPYYIILIVIVNSSDHNGTQEQEERL